MTTYNCQNLFKVQDVTLKMTGIFGVVKATCSHLDLVSTVKLMTDNLKKNKRLNQITGTTEITKFVHF